MTKRSPTIEELPPSKSSIKTGRLHYWLSGLLGVALIPLLRQLNLPLKFDWSTLLTAYWLVLMAQSIFVATLLWLLVAGRRARQPLIAHSKREPFKIIFLLLYFVALGWALSWGKAAVLTVDTFALLELYKQDSHKLRHTVTELLGPAFYLFAGFLLVFAYNDIIASVRFGFASDQTFQAMDTWMLRGRSVSGLSHWAAQTFPLSFFHFLEFIYFGMFPQIGAAMIMVTLYEGRYRGVQLVGTILMAYYLALGLFYLWPSQGPYYLCPQHFSRFPETLQAYSIQKTLIARALGLWNHIPIRNISTDYFIAFPCMHVAQPLIVMWFLRRWKGAVAVLCAYDVLLIGAILLLEWHYVIDLIGGVLVAGIAIAVTHDAVPNQIDRCDP